MSTYPEIELQKLKNGGNAKSQSCVRSVCYLELSVLYTITQNRLRPVSIAALLVARAQRLTLRHAQQENNEVRDDRELSYGS